MPRRALHADGMLHITLRAAEAGTIRFVARFTVVDPVSLWRPGSGQGRGTLPPSWDAPRTTRALADIPIGCLLGRHDASLVGFGVVAAARPVQVRAGMIEETGEFLLELHVEDSAEAEIVIDLRGRGFAESLSDLAQRDRVPPRAGHPPRRAAGALHLVLVPSGSGRTRPPRRRARRGRAGHRHDHHRRRVADGRCRARLRVVRRLGSRAGQDPRPSRARARTRSTRSADAVVDRDALHRVPVAGVPRRSDRARV